MADVQLKNIQKRFGDHAIFTGLDLAVNSGEYVVLLGPSGCGKTTLLKIIAGLESSDNGEVFIDGQNVGRVPPRGRDVSFVFQNDALYPHLTLGQSIRLGLKGLPSREQSDRIQQACDLTQSHDLLDRMPTNLSGGELRRAAITKAVARGGSVRLLDEPLSALDTHVRHQIQAALLNWHTATDGSTIHVTHDGLQAMRVADRIAVMGERAQANGGQQIIQFAKPEEIFAQPASKTVALSIGWPPMNFVSLRLLSQDAEPLMKVHPDGGAFLPDRELSEVEIGFRHSDADVVQDDVTSSNDVGISFKASVKRIEFINGSHLHVFDLGGHDVLVDTHGQRIANQADARLFVSAAKLHFFDQHTGLRIGDSV